MGFSLHVLACNVDTLFENNSIKNVCNEMMETLPAAYSNINKAYYFFCAGCTSQLGKTENDHIYAIWMQFQLIQFSINSFLPIPFSISLIEKYGNRFVGSKWVCIHVNSFHMAHQSVHLFN